jgi:hypothetical protein
MITITSQLPPQPTLFNIQNIVLINLVFDKSDRMLYPNDETSLIKLHKDLTMELLWIEQAIESRISVSSRSW